MGHIMGTVVPPVVVEMPTRRGSKVESGIYRVGSYQLDESSNCKWLCIDFDGGDDHHGALADPLGCAFTTITGLINCGLAPYLEKSGGGQGWHVWVFFNEPVAAKLVRQLALECVPKSAPLVREIPNVGKFAKPESGIGIEVFPKQDTLPSKGYGNQVWLPWFHGASKGGNQFYKRNPADNELIAWYPDADLQRAHELRPI